MPIDVAPKNNTELPQSIKEFFPSSADGVEKWKLYTTKSLERLGQFTRDIDFSVHKEAHAALSSLASQLNILAKKIKAHQKDSSSINISEIQEIRTQQLELWGVFMNAYIKAQDESVPSKPKTPTRSPVPHNSKKPSQDAKDITPKDTSLKGFELTTDRISLVRNFSNGKIETLYSGGKKKFDVKSIIQECFLTVTNGAVGERLHPKIQAKLDELYKAKSEQYELIKNKATDEEKSAKDAEIRKTERELFAAIQSELAERYNDVRNASFKDKVSDLDFVVSDEVTANNSDKDAVDSTTPVSKKTKPTASSTPKAVGTTNLTGGEPVDLKLSKEDELLEKKLSSKNIDNEIARIDKNIERVHGMRKEMGLNVTEARKVSNLPGFESARRNLVNIKNEMEQLKRAADEEFTPEELVAFKRLRVQAAENMMRMRTAVQEYRKKTPPTPVGEVEDVRREYRFRGQRDEDGERIISEKVRWTDKKTGENKQYINYKEDKTQPLLEENKVSLDYLKRREARKNWKSKQKEYDSLFEKKSHKYVGRFLGLNPRGFKKTKDELNVTKHAYAGVLLPALVKRAENQKKNSTRARFSETALDTQKLKNTKENKETTANALEGIERIDSAYKAWFIQRYVIDDAKRRIEAQRKLLSEEKQKQIKQLGVFLKKHKWTLRIGSIALAGGVAAGGVAIAGAGLGAAAATAAGAAALGRTKRVALGATVGLGAAMITGAGTHRLFDSVVGEKKDRLIKTESRTNALSYNKLMSDMDSYTDEYKDSYRALQKARTMRTAATATVAGLTGVAVGMNSGDIIDAMSTSPTPDTTMIEGGLPDIGVDTGEALPNVTSEAEVVRPDYGAKLSSSDVNDDPGSKILTPLTEQFSAETPPSTPPPDSLAESRTVVETISVPAEQQVFEIPDGHGGIDTIEETLLEAWKAGKVEDLPDDMTEQQFLRGLRDSTALFRGNDRILELMSVEGQKPLTNIDLVFKGNGYNFQPYIDHMNGISVEDIESGVRDEIVTRTIEVPTESLTEIPSPDSTTVVTSPEISTETITSTPLDEPAISTVPSTATTDIDGTYTTPDIRAGAESELVTSTAEIDVDIKPSVSEIESTYIPPEGVVPKNTLDNELMPRAPVVQNSEGVSATLQSLGFSESQIDAVTNEFYSRVSDNMTDVEQSVLLETISQREMLSARMDSVAGVSPENGLKLLFDVSPKELINAIQNETLGTFLEDKGIQNADFYLPFIEKLNALGLLNSGSNFSVTLENALGKNQLEIVTTMMGEEKIRIGTRGLFGNATTINL